MEVLTNIFAAFGLSGSAGLNAYLPLLVVALTAHTDLIKLNEPWDTLKHPAVIGLLVVLLIIEFFADKIPAINHANDVIQTFVRPTAGAILFAASMSTIAEVNPVFALMMGLLAAGAVHGTKSVVLRPAVTAATGGTANPVVSVVEDVVALTVSVMAVVLPVIMAGIIVLIVALGVWLLWRNATKKRPQSSL